MMTSSIVAKNLVSWTKPKKYPNNLLDLPITYTLIIVKALCLIIRHPEFQISFFCHITNLDPTILAFDTQAKELQNSRDPSVPYFARKGITILNGSV